jgi:hypothetical protein
MPIQHPRQTPDEDLSPDPWIESVLRDMGLSSALESLRPGTGGPWRVCVEAGLATTADILTAYSRRFGVTIADLKSTRVTVPGRGLPGVSWRWVPRPPCGAGDSLDQPGH